MAPSLHNLSHSPAAQAALASIAAFVVAALIGRKLIPWLRVRCQEPNTFDSPTLERLHQHKTATPTLGGLFLLGGALAAIVLCGDWNEPFTALAVGVLLAFGALGAWDDVCKLRHRRGLRARTKFIVQTALALIAAAVAYAIAMQQPHGAALAIPGTSWELQLGWLYIPWAALVLVGASNSVNLTDGLDGLAAGCLLFALAAFGLLGLATQDSAWSAALHLPAAPQAGVATTIAAALFGGAAAFLRFNRRPAQVFMGDCGALPLGALLGLVALACRQELLLLVIGGVFVVETLSVMLQVASFKTTGRRVFRCAPLHHHFQFLGWPEEQVVRRFWLAGAACAMAGLTAAATPRLLEVAQVDPTPRTVVLYAPPQSTMAPLSSPVVVSSRSTQSGVSP